MAVGDILEAALTIQNVDNKDRYVNVLHWIVNTDPAGVTPEQDLCAYLNNIWTMNVRPHCNVKMNFKLCVVQRVFPLPRTAGWYEDNGDANIGGIAGDALPPACAYVLRKRTNLAGRKYRGRLYQGGLSEVDQANGLFASANCLNILNAWEEILTTLAVGPGAGEYSAVLWPKNGASVEDANLITRVQADNVVRQQRRREVNVGS